MVDRCRLLSITEQSCSLTERFWYDQGLPWQKLWADGAETDSVASRLRAGRDSENRRSRESVRAHEPHQQYLDAESRCDRRARTAPIHLSRRRDGGRKRQNVAVRGFWMAGDRLRTRRCLAVKDVVDANPLVPRSAADGRSSASVARSHTALITIRGFAGGVGSDL